MQYYHILWLLLSFNLEIIPVIDSHPIEQEKCISNDDESLTLECKARGAKLYQWERKEGEMPSNVDGVDSNILTINKLQLKSAGSYRCKVINGDVVIFSEYAKITIFCESLLFKYLI